MTGYKIVNLKMMIDEIGEEATKSILSNFSCPANLDVQNFLRLKAIEFSKQGLSQTHLVFASYKSKPVLVGYFTLANKYITIAKKKLSSKIRHRIAKFSQLNPEVGNYCLSAPLIAQIGKNYTNEYNKLITGDELLKMACDKVSYVQLALGGRVVYLECEDNIRLREFYERNGFQEFERRKLDRDETGVKGFELIQMLKYL